MLLDVYYAFAVQIGIYVNTQGVEHFTEAKLINAVGQRLAVFSAGVQIENNGQNQQQDKYQCQHGQQAADRNTDYVHLEIAHCGCRYSPKPYKKKDYASMCKCADPPPGTKADAWLDLKIIEKSIKNQAEIQFARSRLSCAILASCVQNRAVSSVPKSSKRIRGRAAVSNPASRFHAWRHEAFDDGWGTADEDFDEPGTELIADASRSLIVYNQSPDVPFDRSINPYRGCEHGCVYCFARPTHAYLDCSAGLDFETRIFYKSNAAEILADELGKPCYQCQPLALGVNTDAYQPAERKLKISRRVLEVLLAHRHPVSIVTKSALVERDLDLLADMASRNLVHVMVSVTSLDKTLARTLEPRAAAPRRRLEIIKHLSAAGIPVGVLLAPVIPVLNDGEIESILARVREAGALTAGYVMLRLPREVKDLFSSWLQRHRPLMADHVMHRIRDIRGGRENDSRFGRRMRGTGVYAQLIEKRFAMALARLSFEGMPAFDCSQFRVPRPYTPQLELFE